MAIIAPFRAALPNLKDITSSSDFFGSAKRKFPLYLSDGLYDQIPNEAIFVYRIKRPHRSHTGIIACTDIQDYINKNIKIHEHTLVQKEQQMMRLFQERNAVIKPVLLTYPNVLEIDALINRIAISTSPSFKIKYLDEVHTFWQIEERIRLEGLAELFKNRILETYICDGHHRMKTAEILYNQQKENNPNHTGNEPYNYVMTAYFPASEIEIHNYNRILTSLKGLSSNDFLDKLRHYYHVYGTPKAVQPIAINQLALYVDKQWYKLALKDEFLSQENDNPASALDVYSMNKYILEDILGIEDVREEVEVKYMEGPKGAFGLERKVRENKGGAALLLYPVALEKLIEISDARGTMPPKSTWMEPRMRNGFLAQLYSDL